MQTSIKDKSNTQKKHSNTILWEYRNWRPLFWGLEVIIVIEKWKLSSLFPALDRTLNNDLLIFFIRFTTCVAQVQCIRWLDFDWIWQLQCGTVTVRCLMIPQNIGPIVWLFYHKRTTWWGTMVSKYIVMITTYFVLTLNH